MSGQLGVIMSLNLSFEHEGVLWTRVMEEKNSGNVAIITVTKDEMILRSSSDPDPQHTCSKCFYFTRLAS